MTTFCTAELVEEAFDLVLPAIENLLGSKAKRNAGHIRVSRRDLDPSAGRGWSTVFTRDFGDRETWEHPYEQHATGKERISQRTNMSSRAVQTMHPELLVDGDTVYFGSVINEGKTIVVAYSGVEAYFDELIAKWLLAAIQALIEHKLDAQRQAKAEAFAVAA